MRRMILQIDLHLFRDALTFITKYIYGIRPARVPPAAQPTRQLIRRASRFQFLFLLEMTQTQGTQRDTVGCCGLAAEEQGFSRSHGLSVWLAGPMCFSV